MINRTVPPPILPIGKPGMTPPERISLDNGLPVFCIRANALEMCKIDFLFPAGTGLQERPLQASLTNAMLQEGSEGYTSDELADLFDFHGAFIRLAVDHYLGIVSLVALNRHLPKLMPVLENMTGKAAFPLREFETLRIRRKQRFFVDSEKVNVLCHRKFLEALFGRTHPYAQVAAPEDFDRIGREDLVSFYRLHYPVPNEGILVSGKVDDQVIELLNRYFGAHETNRKQETDENYPLQGSSQRRFFVTKPGAIQSAILVGKLLVPKMHPDFLPLQILTTLLGGYFSSRLMTNIREEKGYTYGVGAYLIGLKKNGYLAIATEVDKAYEEDTLKEIFLEIRRLREEPVGTEELRRVRQYLLGELTRDFDGPFSRSNAFLSTYVCGPDYPFYEAYYRALMDVSPVQLQELARKYFETDSFTTVVAGREG